MNRVFAAVDWNDTLVATAPGFTKDIATIQSLEPLFQNAVTALVALAGVALLIMLLVGGFNFLFSGGDQKRLQAASGTIGNAIIGLVIIVMAYVIINTIGKFTGVSGLDVFKIAVPGN